MTNKRTDVTWGEPIVTPECRASYVYLDNPDTGRRNSSNKYGLDAIFPKKMTKANEDLMKGMMKSFCEVAGVDDLSEIEKHPFLNGDGELRDGDAEDCKDENLKGCIYAKITSKKQPICSQIVEGEDEPVPINEDIEDTIYAGCYVILWVTPVYYEDDDTVSWYVNHVIKTRDGERLAGAPDISAAVNAFDYKALTGNALEAPKSKKQLASKTEVVEDPPKSEKKTTKKKSGRKKATDLSSLM